MPFDLLSEPIRKYVRDKRWDQFRPIQVAAIKRIMTTDCNYILASRTASGKTEAAFLPILSKVNFNEEGVQVLYISPLIALINDQFLRVEELCRYLEISVTKWHSEANKSAKNKLLKAPNGIVLITPESIEAMLVNRAHEAKHLFSNLKYVVIDEIHSFIGTDRGIHLKSLLFRLQSINRSKFCIVGLSATIGDFNEAKVFTGEAENTTVLIDKTAKEINVVFKYFKESGAELSLELMKDLYRETFDNKTLIFPNSRGRAEEVAVKLKKISERIGGHPYYFSHHSSVDKEVREYVEDFAKNNRRNNFTIACTSTLELGIDIGSVDKVVQIDAAHSIASLIQRVGRSGRQGNKQSNLYLYATNNWSLLQSLAAWLLYTEGFIEPPAVMDKPYDILAHQILSVVRERSEIRLSDLVYVVKSDFAFQAISETEITEIINYLFETGMLEKLGREIIIGIEGEKIVNNRDFYSVFTAEQNFKVINEGSTIGELPFSPLIREDENIFLAARIWKIKLVDEKARKIFVVKALDGKRPMFYGGAGDVHPRIRTKMLEILKVDTQYDFLDAKGLDEINELRKDFSTFTIGDILYDRPIVEKIVRSKKEDEDLFVSEFCSFTGTKINRTIGLFLYIADVEYEVADYNSMFTISASIENLRDIFESITSDVDNTISRLLEDKPAILDFSKWGKLLPPKYQTILVRDKYYDIENTVEFLRNIQLVEPSTLD
ncbi:DEAD/DEAH box helicase [Dysgonomonas macrotermitis]|uniref:ATP-dependent helicase Lhr and Lhr-like helicase n=1 Tax=Dysgonomonas macrotermitis TaxID=1346286 RepID=A0A1M4YCW4_9BACT|nr:DEAD/DEAH box helicase [Dysgonomonas macrotermitis]SHF03585.1 ATP-dependent helicase Lhr and Lhr-like helicase [Dysgonomonas macrotermitis]